MILSGSEHSFIERLNYVLRGLDDEAPAADTDEYNYWIDTLHMKLEELYADTTKQWNNTYEDIELGTVSATATPTFDLDETFLSPANVAYIIDANGRRQEFSIIKAQEKDPDKQEVYVAGQDPETLYFTQEIKAGSNLVTGTLFLPAFVMPDMPTLPDDFIPAPDPNWAVYATASQIAENDITYEDKAASLNAKANNLYTLMSKKSIRGTYGNSRKTPVRPRVKLGQRHR